METEEKENSDTYREYPICRTCLNVIRCRSYRLQENSGFGDGLKISHILRYIVPELYLGLSNSPEICGNCRESLRVAYTFRKLCLETETMIGNYLKNVRCTAQVIDLGAVINYLSKKKVGQNAQKIISEWEDDSSEDLPTTSDTPSSKKIPISDLESLKHVVKQLAKKSEKSKDKEDIESTYSTLEATHIELVKDNVKTVTSKEPFSKTDVLKFDSKSGFFLNSAGKKFIIRDEKAFLVDNPQNAEETKDTEPHRYANPIDENKKIVVYKTPILDRANLSEIAKPTEKIPDRSETSDSDAVSISDSECSSIIELDPISKSPTTPETASKDESASKDEAASKDETASKDVSEPTAGTEKPASMPKLQQILTVCEETGLLKNGKGEFFNLDGTPMNKQQVEAEINKAKIRGETLFEISNICTVTDDTFESVNKKIEIEKTDQEEEIPVNLIEKETNPAHNSKLLTTRITKYVGNITVKKTADLQNPVEDAPSEEAQPSSVRKVVKNPVPKTYERNASTTKDPQTGKQSLVLNPLVKGGSQVSSDPDAQPVHQPKTNILNFLMNKNLGLPEMPVIRFNMESKMAGNKCVYFNCGLTPYKDPALRIFRFPVNNSSLCQEWILKSGNPELTNLSPAELRKKFICSNHFDDRYLLARRLPSNAVPKMYTDNENDDMIDPFLNLPSSPLVKKGVVNIAPLAAKKKRLILPKKSADLTSFHTPTFDGLTNVSSNDSIENLVRIKDEPPDFFGLDNVLGQDSEDTLSAPDVEAPESWQNIINSLDDTNSNYVDVPEFVKINNVNLMDMEQLHEIHYSNKNGNPSEIPKLSDILLQKVSRSKEEPPLRQPINAVTDRALWESLPEKFPYNGKMLIKCGSFYKFEEEKVVPKQRRIRMVPVSCTPVAPKQPQQEKKIEKYPDREVCVLFTNYSSDGSYINDHDYLVAPYIRNKLIVQEDKNIYCVCFICGFKHRMQNHAKHMTIHSSTCPACYVDVRTPYMLNLHMKTHAKPCLTCLGIVPYVNISKHENMHFNGGCSKVIFPLGDDDEEDDEDEEEYNEIFGDANRYIKTCYVPSCKNTSKNSSKIFVYVPRKNHLNWFKFVGRNRVPSKQNLFWCCEDHFDMKEDFENWQEYKLLTVKLRLKQGVLPHKFIDSPSTLDKSYSQLDDESKKIREENTNIFNSEKVAKADLLELATEEDEWMNSRLRTRLLAGNKNDPKRTKIKPSESGSNDADEPVRRSQKSRGRRSARPRGDRTQNKIKKYDSPAIKRRKVKTEIDELTDTNEAFGEETENSSFEKSIENYEVGKSESVSKLRRVRKRASREIECLNEDQLSNKRVLRTRAKKSNEATNESESY